MSRRPLRSRLFPYTTLFRSLVDLRLDAQAQLDVLPLDGREQRAQAAQAQQRGGVERRVGAGLPRGLRAGDRAEPAERAGRSEEHTSELQSQFHLVCRLLLEK